MTTPARYIEIYGLQCTGQIKDDGVQLKDPGLQLNQVESAASLFGAYTRQSWKPRVYDISAFFKPGDETNLELFLQTVNQAPPDSRFYPHRNDRFAWIDVARASVGQVKGASTPGGGGWGSFWPVDIEITCRDPYLWGPDQGIPYEENNSYPPTYLLPLYSATLTNNGHLPATLDYLQVSGDYYNSIYLTNLTAGFVDPANQAETDRLILLCSKLMRNDLFELGWRDGVRHSYSQNFAGLWSDVDIDLQGYTAGGVQYGQSVTLYGATNDFFAIPFRGPLPLVGNNTELQPYFDVWVSAVTGNGGHVGVATLNDVSDFTWVGGAGDISTPGYHRVWLADLEGSGDIFIGLQASGAGNSITITQFAGVVNRYLSRKYLADTVYADPATTFQVAVKASGYLKKVQAITNNCYYY